MEFGESPARMPTLVGSASRLGDFWEGRGMEYGLTAGFTVSTASSPSSAVSSSPSAARTTGNVNVRQALAAMIVFLRVCSPNPLSVGGPHYSL